MTLTLAHDQHVDWPALLGMLGLSDTVVAERIGATEWRVRKWRQINCQPRHDDGTRLIALWLSSGRAMSEVPITSRYA